MSGEFESFHKDMAELTRRDALKALLMGALSVSAVSCGVDAVINGQQDTDGTGNTSNTVDTVSTLTGSERQEKAIKSFLESRPEYKGRDMFAINIAFQGIDSDTVVIESNDKEKTEINSFKYTYEGQEYQPYDNAVIYTQKITKEGVEWVRLAGVWFPTDNGTVITAWYYSKDAFKKGVETINYTDKVFGFNSNDKNFVYWPLIEPPYQIKWSANLGSKNPDDYTEWNGNDPFTISMAGIKSNPSSSRALFSPRPVEAEAPKFNRVTKTENAAEMSVITLKDLEAYSNWILEDAAKAPRFSDITARNIDFVAQVHPNYGSTKLATRDKTSDNPQYSPKATELRNIALLDMTEFGFPGRYEEVYSYIRIDKKGKIDVYHEFVPDITSLTDSGTDVENIRGFRFEPVDFINRGTDDGLFIVYGQDGKIATDYRPLLDNDKFYIAQGTSKEEVKGMIETLAENDEFSEEISEFFRNHIFLPAKSKAS